ncbi:DUF6894 family protein [Sphingomonas montana]
MPQYHFHINGENDSEGYEFSNIRVAQREVLALAGTIISEHDSVEF